MRHPAPADCPISPEHILSCADGADEGYGHADGHVQAEGEMSGEIGMKEGGELIESTEEEIKFGRVMPTPKLPTQSELQDHIENGHNTYRQWLAECVEGFGR